MRRRRRPARQGASTSRWRVATAIETIARCRAERDHLDRSGSDILAARLPRPVRPRNRVVVIGTAHDAAVSEMGVAGAATRIGRCSSMWCARFAACFRRGGRAAAASSQWSAPRAASARPPSRTRGWGDSPRSADDPGDRSRLASAAGPITQGRLQGCHRFRARQPDTSSSNAVAKAPTISAAGGAASLERVYDHGAKPSTRSR